MKSSKPYIRPRVSTGRHPIETGRYLIGTQVIEAFNEKVCQWIDNRVPGGMIFGKPRLGKTRAIHYLSHTLPERFGSGLQIIPFTCRDYRTASEASFFEDLLKESGHSIIYKGKATEKRNRLSEFLYERVCRSNQDRIILFIDEAQKLHENHYNWLIDLHNELDKLNINFITLLVGQHELLHQYSAFSHTKKAQIIGRFMVHQHEFHGLRSIEDVVVCLNGYDEDSEHPIESGWSFTRYFYPAVFDTGWRLALSSEDLWESFLEIREEYGFSDTLNIPMQYFCRTVEYILRHFSSLNDDPPNLSINVWKEAIIKSGYVEAEERHAPKEII